MLRKIIIILLLIIVLSAIAVWQAPASVVAWALEQQQHPLQLALTGGKAINGHANQATWQGMQLGRAQWQVIGFHPTQAAVDLAVETDGELQLQGTVTMKSGGRLESDNLQGSMPASWIKLQSTIPFVYLGGTISWDFSRMSYRNNEIPSAQGRFLWEDAALRGLARAKLGDIEIQLQESETGQHARIASLSSEDISLQGGVTTNGNQYDLDLTIQVDPRRPDIFEFLSRFGQVQGRTIRFQHQGTLFPQ